MPEHLRPDPIGEHTVALSDQDSPGKPAAAHVATDPSFRYELREQIARGGMGEVYLADDRTLGRQVAVKILQDRYKTGSAVARRFVDEARISGQLQHPGIPPIHDLGTLPDGRPFLAMKLIKGRTLDALLAERPSPGADRGRFLAAFEQVCQALAYAHRVIHRDLKPDNIMVGAFGEVQVMDWGLAKVLGRATEQTRSSDSDERLATEILTARDDSDGSETQAGSVLGTPAYMAPEQAVGAVEQIDERSDVFGLGAVLAVILTGRPPYSSESAESTRVLAARGKLDDCFARLDTCGAEPELVALCKSCLNPDRDDRPSDAGAIARAVAAFRAEAEERARQAELDRVRAEGERARLEAEARAQRQKRRAQLAVTVGALALLVVGVAAWVTTRNQAEARRNDADRLASVALGRAEQLEAQAQAIDPEELSDANAALKLWEQAEAAVAQAETAIAGVGGASLRARVSQKASSVRSGLTTARRAAKLLAALENAEGASGDTSGGAVNYKEERRLYRSAFEEAGLPAGGDPATLAAAVRSERPGLCRALLKVLDRWNFSFYYIYPLDPDADRVRATADLVDGDPLRKEIRAAAASTDKKVLRNLADRLASVDLPPASALVLGNAMFLDALRSGLGRQECVRILRRALEGHPSDNGLLTNLSMSIWIAYRHDPVRMEEAIGYARTLVALHPNNAYSHDVLGQVLLSANQDLNLSSAEFHFRKTFELNPRFTGGMTDLAEVLQIKGDLAGAEPLYRSAVEIDPLYVGAQIGLGQLLLQKGDLSGAEAAYLKAISLNPKDQRLAKGLALVQRLSLLLPRLDDVVAGRSAPVTPAESVDFALLCSQPFRRQYDVAVRLFERVFAADPKLAEDLASRNRYNAACCAALAARDQGVEAPTAPADRTALRGKALIWLRADLAEWREQAASEKPFERMVSYLQMTNWLEDPDLATVRPGDPKYDLPADERPAWESLWADVRAMLEAASKPATPAAKP